VGPCHHCMTPPRVADGGDGLQIRRIVENILNKLSYIADKGWGLGTGRGATNASP
jgi:hypothetical protein